MKKGQVALEFLMTYGWAILIVMVAIGALAYFGVLNPSNYMPQRCLSQVGFSCVGDPLIYSNNVTFSLSNGKAKNIDLTGANFICTSGDCTLCTTHEICGVKGDLSSCATTSSAIFNDGETRTFRARGCSFSTKTAFKGTFKLSYKNSDSGLMESVNIDVSGRITT